jgi:hypothetical protein
MRLPFEAPARLAEGHIRGFGLLWLLLQRLLQCSCLQLVPCSMVRTAVATVPSTNCWMSLRIGVGLHSQKGLYDGRTCHPFAAHEGVDSFATLLEHQEALYAMWDLRRCGRCVCVWGGGGVVIHVFAHHAWSPVSCGSALPVSKLSMAQGRMM